MKSFISEYLIDLNATQAAIRAGYSKKTAHSQGQRLLRNVEVQGAIQAAMAERSKRVEVTQDMIMSELAKIGFGDCRPFEKLKALELLGKHIGMFDGIKSQDVRSEEMREAVLEARRIIGEIPGGLT